MSPTETIDLPRNVFTSFFAPSLCSSLALFSLFYSFREVTRFFKTSRCGLIYSLVHWTTRPPSDGCDYGLARSGSSCLLMLCFLLKNRFKWSHDISWSWSTLYFLVNLENIFDRPSFANKWLQVSKQRCSFFEAQFENLMERQPSRGDMELCRFNVPLERRVRRAAGAFSSRKAYSNLIEKASALVST